MKKILSVVFAIVTLSIVLKAQTDTIITNKSETIICKITKLTSMNIFYTEKGVGKSLPLVEVKHHSTSISQANADKQQSKAFIPLTAGDELIKAKQHFYRGAVLGLVGVGISYLGISSSPETGKISPMIYFGSIVSLAGIIMSIESFSHIGKAGQLMNEKKGLTFAPTVNGLSLCYRF